MIHDYSIPFYPRQGHGLNTNSMRQKESDTSFVAIQTFMTAVLMGIVATAVFWGSYIPAKHRLERMVKVDCHLSRIECNHDKECCNPQINKFDCGCDGACQWTAGHLFPMYAFNYLGVEYERAFPMVGKTCPANIPFDCSAAQNSTYQTWATYNRSVCYIDPEKLDDELTTDLIDLRATAAMTGSRFIFSCIFFSIFCLLVISCSFCCCMSFGWSCCQSKQDEQTRSVEVTSV